MHYTLDQLLQGRRQTIKGLIYCAPPNYSSFTVPIPIPTILVTWWWLPTNERKTNNSSVSPQPQPFTINRDHCRRPTGQDIPQSWAGLVGFQIEDSSRHFSMPSPASRAKNSKSPEAAQHAGVRKAVETKHVNAQKPMSYHFILDGSSH